MPRDPSPPIHADFNHLGTAYAVLSYRIPQNPILLELTPAELEVLELWLDGASAEEVSTLRGCAVRTVNNQVASIYRKLGAGSRAELATMVRSSGQYSEAGSARSSDQPPKMDSTPPASHRRPTSMQRPTSQLHSAVVKTGGESRSINAEVQPTGEGALSTMPTGGLRSVERARS
jgi:DNA-binding CsgD family transcriptional regulator